MYRMTIACHQWLVRLFRANCRIPIQYLLFGLTRRNIVRLTLGVVKHECHGEWLLGEIGLWRESKDTSIVGFLKPWCQ